MRDSWEFGSDHDQSFLRKNVRRELYWPASRAPFSSENIYGIKGISLKWYRNVVILDFLGRPDPAPAIWQICQICQI